MRKLSLILLLIFLACTPAEEIELPPDIILPPNTTLPSSGTKVLEVCSTLGTGSEQCSWDFFLDPEQCQDQSCRKLLLFFAGGGMQCPGEGVFDPFVQGGYVAVCLKTFDSAQGSGEFSFIAEASRVNTLIKDVVNNAVIKQAWNGEELFFSGTSHGATAPVVAMAQTDLDEQGFWKGSRCTAACFYDGIADVAFLDTFLGDNNCGLSNSVLSHNRAIGRYYTEGVFSHSCDNTQCACDAEHNEEIDMDSAVQALPSTFSIKDWKLIECGSQTEPCTSDVIPAEPIESLCTSLDEDVDHSCTFQSRPLLPHSACALPEDCQSFFDGLGENCTP